MGSTWSTNREARDSARKADWKGRVGRAWDKAVGRTQHFEAGASESKQPSGSFKTRWDL